jgi:hypothetical protein
MTDLSLFRTPSTTRQLKDLSQSLHSCFENGTVVDTPCKNRVQKLLHAAEQSFTERVLLMDENRILFQQNCEKTIRQSHAMTVVGAGRVVSHEDIVVAREKRGNAEGQSRRAKRTHQEMEEAQNDREVSLEEPWMKYAGVIQF